jgi:hypothetical protein
VRDLDDWLVDVKPALFVRSQPWLDSCDRAAVVNGTLPGQPNSSKAANQSQE